MTKASGFSLIEILVAMGILGVVSLSVGALMAGMNSQVQRANVKFDQSQLAEQINNALRNPISCKWIMQSNSVTIPSQSTSPINLTRLANFNQTGGVVNEIVPALNTDLSGTRLEVSSIQLTGPGTPTAGPQLAGPAGGSSRAYVADVIVTVQHDFPSLAQFKPITVQGLALTVNGSSNAVEACGWTSDPYLQGGNSFGSTATLGTNDNFALNFETNGSAKMTIQPDGNVGIGIMNPDARLVVQGGNLKVSPQSLSSYPGSWGWGVHTWDVFAEGTIGTGRNGDVKTSMNAEGHAHFDGNVGIGTRTPASKLSVIGDASISGNLTVGGAYCSGTTCRRMQDLALSNQTCPAGQVQIGTNTDGTARCRAIQCSGSNYFAGLDSSGNAICRPYPTNTCPTNQYVASVNADGTVQCAVLPNNANSICPAGQVLQSISAGVPTCVVPNADTVDGLHASSFLRKDTSDTMDGNLNVTGTVTASGGVRTNQVCDSSGGNCVAQSALRTVSGGSCPAGQVVTGINSNGSPICGTVSSSVPSGTHCGLRMMSCEIGAVNGRAGTVIVNSGDPNVLCQGYEITGTGDCGTIGQIPFGGSVTPPNSCRGCPPGYRCQVWGTNWVREWACIRRVGREGGCAVYTTFAMATCIKD